MLLPHYPNFFLVTAQIALCLWSLLFFSHLISCKILNKSWTADKCITVGFRGDSEGGYPSASQTLPNFSFQPLYETRKYYSAFQVRTEAHTQKLKLKTSATATSDH